MVGRDGRGVIGREAREGRSREGGTGGRVGREAREGSGREGGMGGEK